MVLISCFPIIRGSPKKDKSEGAGPHVSEGQQLGQPPKETISRGLVIVQAEPEDTHVRRRLHKGQHQGMGSVSNPLSRRTKFQQ